MVEGHVCGNFILFSVSGKGKKEFPYFKAARYALFIYILSTEQLIKKDNI